MKDSWDHECRRGQPLAQSIRSIGARLAQAVYISRSLRLPAERREEADSWADGAFRERARCWIAQKWLCRFAVQGRDESQRLPLSFFTTGSTPRAGPATWLPRWISVGVAFERSSPYLWRNPERVARSDHLMTKCYPSPFRPDTSPPRAALMRNPGIIARFVSRLWIRGGPHKPRAPSRTSPLPASGVVLATASRQNSRPVVGRRPACIKPSQLEVLKSSRL